MVFDVVTKLKNSCLRYTSMASALDILFYNRITLLNPSTWDDKNDTYFLERYRRSLGDESKLSALCFTTASETFHHWKVFTTGDSGICIEFNRDRLVSLTSDFGSVNTGDVNYFKYNDLKVLENSDRDKLPSLKRVGFGDEREWRIISRSVSISDHVSFLPISPDFVNKIVLSPFMPEQLVATTKRVIRSVEGYSRVRIDVSRLTDSNFWKRQGDRIFD